MFAIKRVFAAPPGKTSGFADLFLFRGFFVNFPFKGQGGRSGTSSPAVGKASRSNETTWSELVRLSGQAVLPLPQQRWPREELHPPSDPETGFWVFRPGDRPIQREPLQIDVDISHARLRLHIGTLTPPSKLGLLMELWPQVYTSIALFPMFAKSLPFILAHKPPFFFRN